MNALHARLIADYCKRPELEAMLLDERLAYFAMHEAESTLTQCSDPSKNQAWQYELRLREILERDQAWGYVSYQLLHATAEQRVEAFFEAFLKINKWTEKH